MNPKDQQHSFEVSLFRFHFVSALHYLDCYYNKHPVKQTASLYLKLPFELAYFSVFLVIFGKISLCLF